MKKVRTGKKWGMVNCEWLMEDGKKKYERGGEQQVADGGLAQKLGLTRGGIQFNGRNNGKDPQIWRCYAKFAN